MRSTLGGLEDFRVPCARVLSVAGFFVIMTLFPRRGRLFLRVKRDTFLTNQAVLFDVPHETVIGPATLLSNSLFTRGRAGWEAVYTRI